MLWLLIALVAASAAFAQEDVVGSRPYEMEWAGRTEDHHPPLIGFDGDLSGWTVEGDNAVASFVSSREQLLWGDRVAKLTYRATGNSPEVRIIPPEPIAIDGPWDAVTLWVYGNNWFGRDPSTPMASISAVFEDAAGEEFGIELTRVRWEEWFMPHRRLEPEQIARVADGSALKRFVIRNCYNKDDRVLFFNSLVTYTEELAPLQFEPRPKRGVAMFPGQDVALNTGPGVLPFPTREETILPPNLTDDFTTALQQQGDAWLFTYAGADGTLVYRIAPQSGTWSDVSAQWQGRGAQFRPLVDGGVRLAVGDETLAPESAELLGAEREGDTLTMRWRVSAGGTQAEVAYTFRLWNKSLVIDTICTGGAVAEVAYGHAEGLESPRLVTNPYYVYRPGRPSVAVTGTAAAPLFLTGNTDWYRSNSSILFGANDINGGRVSFQGGARYTPKTDGVRNDCFERFFVTVSPVYEEVLPIIPNPRSPWYDVTGSRVWRAHGVSNRERDEAFWRRVHRYGMTEVVITDHETMWRDGGESFTFRTKTAPGRGGDESAYNYARVLQDELGFTYGPYNNFTDHAAVNEFFNIDMVERLPDNQLRHAWTRCYAPKAWRAVEFCAKLSPILDEKFDFSTAYCDVHTAVAPWDREDYDARVPGAGTFAATFYPYGEIMLLQKQAWDGPVYSEGGMQWMYVGLTDGNYGQDQRYNPNQNPWLVDFDLRRMHDLCTSFGMGNIGMFFGRNASLGSTREEIDASIDRFLAATIAFGHTGFLTFEGSYDKSLRSYYMLQQLHSDYAPVSAQDIRYVNAAGELLDTSAALATGAFRRSQVVTRYANGTVTAANGSRTERMVCDAFGHPIDLPPNGYAGWAGDGTVAVISDDARGHRTDYAVTPAYIYVDGRGTMTRFTQAAGDGVGVCRILGDGRYEIIPYMLAECGFAIDASQAVALDQAGAELGPAQVRHARGMTWVQPVEGAFSYILSGGAGAVVELACERETVVAGETVTVRGAGEHEVVIPADALPGDHLWREAEGGWIDFTVVPLAEADFATEENTLVLTLTSNLADAREFAVAVGGQTQTVELTPDEPRELRFDLGEPEHEAANVLVVELRAGDLLGRIERTMQIVRENEPVAALPDEVQFGMRLRGAEETSDFGDTRAYVGPGQKTCGLVTKNGLSMHPPWVGGTGYVFATWGPVELPADTPAAFRALVGKGDGSDPGDGILYKLAVIDEAGEETIIGEQTVTEHEWLPIEGDLSPWAGQTVRPKLIADAGVADDSSGDWACAAEMRIETLKPRLLREISASSEANVRLPAPYPVEGLTVEQMRSATRAWLHYDGIGLSGTGDRYGTFAVVNDIELGNMASAGGNESENVWVERLAVPLTNEAIRTLDFRNRFELRNPGQDYFKVRRFWLELELADGRTASSMISAATFTQPPSWPYAEGIGVGFDENIAVDIWFER